MIGEMHSLSSFKKLPALDVYTTSPKVKPKVVSWKIPDLSEVSPCFPVSPITAVESAITTHVYTLGSDVHFINLTLL